MITGQVGHALWIFLNEITEHDIDNICIVILEEMYWLRTMWHKHRRANSVLQIEKMLC